MKSLIVLLFLLFSQPQLYAQNGPALLLDGLPSGSLYTDSLGNLSLTGASNYEILGYSIYTNDNDSNILHLSGKSTVIGPLLKTLPSGYTVTILARVGCPTCISMKLKATYTIP
ncbi:MAG: hypothetical protein NXI10_14795 [bacterium]|nr:hypothetical protein [bacterium]